MSLGAHFESDEKLSKLRSSLQHWQTLELDYEGLNDELSLLDEQTTPNQCLGALRDFAPHKIDDNELQTLVKPATGRTRTPAQIRELLSQRLRYVATNIDTLGRQLTDLEKQRNDLLIHVAKDEELGDESLPVLEILEELDDAGNIVSSTLQPAEAIGVHDQQARSSTTKDFSATSTVRNDDIASDSSDEVSESDTVSQGGVNSPLHQPVNADDTEEEAKLRQEMLQYGLDEVGNIVAELELATELDIDDQDMSDLSDIELDESSDEDTDEDADDETGHAKHLAEAQKYQKRMQRLQQQLEVQMSNVGPQVSLNDDLRAQIDTLSTSQAETMLEHLPPDLRKTIGRARPDAKEAARKAAIARYEASKGGQRSNQQLEDDRKKQKSKKRVAFAEQLDIAGPTQSQMITTKQSSPAEARRDQDEHLESSHAGKQLPRQSRGRVISENLIERETSRSMTQAPDPDDFDLSLQKRQIALELHQLENRRVHENQGGYVNGGEGDNWGSSHAVPSVSDPETGQTKRVSRFKAARMRP